MTKVTTTKLTGQIIAFVTSCLILAEILIFIPSASYFQYRWFETQWQHFVVQFAQDDKSQSHKAGADVVNQRDDAYLSRLQKTYLAEAERSAIRFHPPEFICWQDEQGQDYRIGHNNGDAVSFNLGANPLRHVRLTLQIIIGLGPEQVIIYDDRRDKDFRAIWSTDLLRDQLQAYALRIAALTLMIGLIIIAPLYWFLTTYFVNPLRQITSHMNDFSQDPAMLLEPLRITGAAHEIAAIAHALSSLTEDVRRALRQKERLADIGEATAKINHDLRNILVSATLVTDTLSGSDDPKIRRIAPHIERAISDATNMTQNMMHYLSETKPEEISDFDLDEMAHNLTHDTKLDVHLSGVTSLNGMPNTLYRLLLNLARNAKSAGASHLMIDVWRAGHLAVIDISDNGPGIDKMLKPHLFSAFYSGHRSNTGLGLAIAKDLSVAMGGDLRLSRSSAEGSEFRLSVPKSWLKS